jgi:hypothetical protein
MWKTYLISYDVAENGDYNKLFEAIKAYKTWAHITESLWAIQTSQNSVEIRDNLVKYLPEGSRLFIILSGLESAWINVICSNEWLKNNL